MRRNSVIKSVFLQIWSRFGIWQDWVSLAFVLLTLGAAVDSVEKVVWVTPQPSLISILLLAVLATFVLTKSRLPAVVKHFFIVLLGPVVTVWQVSALFAPKPWLQVLHVKPNESTVYFTVFLILVTWIIGYLSTWFILQRRNAWVTIALGALMVMVNLNNLPSKEYYHFFPVYVLTAVLLLGQTNMTKRLWQLKKYGQRYSTAGTIFYAGTVMVFSLAVAFTAFVLPEVRLNPEAALSTKISWNGSEKHWFNVFAAVTGKRESLPSVKESELYFTDPPYHNEDPQFTVNSDKVNYWRTRRYDSYMSWGWTGTSTNDTLVYPWDESPPSEFSKRQAFTYTVTNKLKSDVLLMAGEFKSASLPVLLQTVSSSPEATQPQKVEARDIISVVSPGALPPDDTYTVTVWLTQATPAELSLAGTDYEKWVTDHYLQLPDSLPERVKELSRQITADAKTPYAEAIEIKNFLQRFTYNIAFNVAPSNVDAVDYFLFEKKAGDCTYFASSMAVMLRSVGVPARVTSGYRLREDNKVGGQFILRAQDYHARVEVYFPKYGWIEFEATPGLPGLSSDDVEGIGSGITTNSAQNSTQNSTDNTTRMEGNAFLNYDEFGNLVDKFGNPINKSVDPYAIQSPLPNIPSAFSTNYTSTLSLNATSNLSRNATSNTSLNATFAAPNVTSNSSRNATPSKATAALSPGENIIPPADTFTGSGPSIPRVFLLIGFLSLLTFFLGVIAIFFYRRLLLQVGRNGDVARVYSRMCVLASLGKSGPKPVETPLEYGFRLALAFPSQTGTIDNITRIYAESRFSKQKVLDQTKKTELEKSWLQLYPALLRCIVRFRR